MTRGTATGSWAKSSQPPAELAGVPKKSKEAKRAADDYNSDPTSAKRRSYTHAEDTSTSTTTTPSWHVYTYTPTEKGIFAPSPYKDKLLPLWRFKTPTDAARSADSIWRAFLEYEEQDDFVGMDNARKFLQMGMTRAARYANHPSGKKYAVHDKKGQTEQQKQAEREKQQVKREASNTFREYWLRVKEWPGYIKRKDDFVAHQREWKKKK